ncbi:MAG: hypothetical protein QME96_11185, partial [Myxococcota bacterium]|nr:hypothetical protein [Myxococcota bacterium]
MSADCRSLGSWARTAATCVALASAAPASADPTIGPEFGIDSPTSGPAYGQQYIPAAAFDGTNYLVAWTDHRAGAGNPHIYAARVTTGGAVLDPAGIAVSVVGSYKRDPSVAFDGTNYLVVWTDYRAGIGDPDIYAARVTPAGTVLDPTGIAVAVGPHNQTEPAVGATNTGGFLVAWRYDSVGGTFCQINGARVSGAGVVLDAWPGFVIGATPSYDLSPAISFDGTDYFVAWSAGRFGNWGVYGARVTTAGMVLDAAGIAISTATNDQSQVSVAFGGGYYLVVWRDFRNGATSGWDIYAARVSTAGVLQDGPPATGGIVVSAEAGTQQYPAVTYGAGDFLVVWGDSRSGSPEVYGARMSAAGRVLDATGIAISTASGPYPLYYPPVVASSGAAYLAVWSDGRTAGVTGYDIYGARLDAGGTVLDPSGFVVSGSADVERAPAAAFDGADYLVVWEENGGAATG